MRPANFVVNREHYAQRCDICHKTDLFNREIGICYRCYALAIPEHTQSLEPELKPLFVELTDQFTPTQAYLSILLSGLVSGLLVDVNATNVTFYTFFALGLSSLASLPFLFKQTHKLHAFTIGFCTTVAIAPLGWLIVILIEWGIKRLFQL